MVKNVSRMPLMLKNLTALLPVLLALCLANPVWAGDDCRSKYGKRMAEAKERHLAHVKEVRTHWKRYGTRAKAEEVVADLQRNHRKHLSQLRGYMRDCIERQEELARKEEERERERERRRREAEHQRWLAEQKAQRQRRLAEQEARRARRNAVREAEQRREEQRRDQIEATNKRLREIGRRYETETDRLVDSADGLTDNELQAQINAAEAREEQLKRAKWKNLGSDHFHRIADSQRAANDRVRQLRREQRNRQFQDTLASTGVGGIGNKIKTDHINPRTGRAGRVLNGGIRATNRVKDSLEAAIDNTNATRQGLLPSGTELIEQIGDESGHMIDGSTTYGKPGSGGSGSTYTPSRPRPGYSTNTPGPSAAEQRRQAEAARAARIEAQRREEERQEIDRINNLLNSALPQASPVGSGGDAFDLFGSGAQTPRPGAAEDRFDDLEKDLERRREIERYWDAVEGDRHRDQSKPDRPSLFDLLDSALGND